MAQETARATEDIAGRVEAIQSDTSSAVGSIAGVTQVIDKINDYQASIATAVEEQSVTTNGMAGDLSSAASGSEVINMGITTVAQAAGSTQQGAESVRAAAAELTVLSGRLRDVVATFRT